MGPAKGKPGNSVSYSAVRAGNTMVRQVYVPSKLVKCSISLSKLSFHTFMIDSEFRPFILGSGFELPLPIIF